MCPPRRHAKGNLRVTRIAVVQTNPKFGVPGHNLDRIEATMRELATDGVELTVFPECDVTGYVYASLEEAMEVAESVPGPVCERLASISAECGVYAVVGTLEREGDRCFNAALLVGPDGFSAKYRKTHTLCLGVDRFTTPGDIPFRVHDLPFGRLGILICYDLRFPEAPRALALAGAQAIALPTNWPAASTLQPDVFTRARAAENRVFVLAADRVGTEREAQFLGRSQIVDPDGAVRREASRDRQEILIADIDFQEADIKNLVMEAGKHEMDCLADRRPELYGAVARVSEPEVRP
jgi:predicted amidohydrolase